LVLLAAFFTLRSTPGCGPCATPSPSSRARPRLTFLLARRPGALLPRRTGITTAGAARSGVEALSVAAVGPWPDSGNGLGSENRASRSQSMTAHGGLKASNWFARQY
jgi:hypothetical protein